MFRRVIQFLIIFFLSNQCFCSDSVKVFTYSFGRNHLHVLRLYETGNYEHLLFSKTKVSIDSGQFIKSYLKLKFESKSRQVGSKSMKDKIIFIRNEKIYDKYWKAVLQKNNYSVRTFDEIYRRSNDFNPLTKKYFVQSVSKDKKISGHKVYFLQLLNQFAPHYKEFIDSNYCGPGCYLTVVKNGTKVPNKDTVNDKLFGDFNTMIHETTHHFNFHRKILIDPDIIIDYPAIKPFESQLINSIVSNEAKAKIFRYTTYLSPQSKLSSNVNGIVGLMDEYSAYRNGTKASVDAAIKAKAQGNEKRTIDFLEEALSTYYAFYEFNLFVAWYLEYGAVRRSHLHHELLKNTNFRIAYTLLEQGFKEDIENLTDLIEENKSLEWRYKYYEENYAQYCKNLLIKKEGILNQFRVKGLTKENYKNYLVE